MMDGMMSGMDAPRLEVSVSALRACLFFIALLAALVWRWRRIALSTALFSLGGLLGVTYWLAQIAGPFGLSTDALLAREWAQAGVNSHKSGVGGFVLGTPAEFSVPAAAAGAGVPMTIVHAHPQIACVVLLVSLILVPRILVRHRTSAAFASVLAISGGLWPGLEPFGSVLAAPTQSMIVFAAAVAAFCLGQVPRARRALGRSRQSAFLGLLALGCAALAVGGLADPLASYAFIGASMMVTSRLRAVIRVLSSSSTARSWEAVLLLAAFCGSGLFWWTPTNSVPGFVEAKDRGDALRTPMNWLAANVPDRDVVLASPAYSAPIAALSRHRVLFRPANGTAATETLPEPFKRARLMESALRGAPIARLAEEFSATHLFLGPGEAGPATDPVATAPDEPEMKLELVYRDAEDFRVFRFLKK